MSTDDQGGRSDKGFVRRHTGVIAAIITASATITAAIIVAKSANSPKPDPTVSMSRPQPTPSPDRPTGIQSTSSGVEYLLDMHLPPTQNALTGNRNLAGQDYPYSVAKGINACTDHGRASVEYPLGGAWKTFDATIGLDQQNSRPNLRVKMTVFVDKKPVGDGYTVTNATGMKLSTVNIENAQSIRLESALLGGDNSCNIVGYAVWGNAKLSK